MNEAQLADEAEATVRRTAWVDDALARLAAERLRTAQVVQRSTCRVIDAWDFLMELSEAQIDAEVHAIVVDELRRQGLSEEQQRVEDVEDAIVEQLIALEETGSFDLRSLSADLFCFLEF